MSKFVRPAPWLRQLFTQSQTEPANPSELSQDVSLVQPYDGGGYPLHPVGEYLITATQSAAASGTETILTCSRDQIARILAVDVLFTVANAATVRFQIDIAGVALSVSVQSLLATVNQPESRELTTPILPPGGSLQVAWFGGNVTTVIRTHVLFARVPLGTVFYL